MALKSSKEFEKKHLGGFGKRCVVVGEKLWFDERDIKQSRLRAFPGVEQVRARLDN